MSSCSPQSRHSAGTQGASPIETLTGRVWPQLSLELAEVRIALAAPWLFQENSLARPRPITKMAAMPARTLPLSAP